MKNKVKGGLVVVLTAIIGICLIKVFSGKEPDNDSYEKDKGSYSYYYAVPSLPSKESDRGINFYNK